MTTNFSTKGGPSNIFDKVVAGLNNCMIFTGCCTDRGYGAVRYKGLVEKAHRVSYMTCIGPIPNDIHVLHKCDNPPCVNPNHLFLGDDKINVHDMMIKGRANQAKKGSVNGRAIVSEADVIEIRKLFDSGEMTITELAYKYKLTWRPTQMIVKRMTWRHI